MKLTKCIEGYNRLRDDIVDRLDQLSNEQLVGFIGIIATKYGLCRGLAMSPMGDFNEIMRCKKPTVIAEAAKSLDFKLTDDRFSFENGKLRSTTYDKYVTAVRANLGRVADELLRVPRAAAASLDKYLDLE